MKLPPIYRSRKINKMLCIMFVILFVISMTAGGFICWKEYPQFSEALKLGQGKPRSR